VTPPVWLACANTIAVYRNTKIAALKKRIALFIGNPPFVLPLMILKLGFGLEPEWV